MFTNPVLRELQELYREASAPEHDVFSGDDTSRHWWARFHAVSRLGLHLGSDDTKKIRESNLLVLFALHYPRFPDGVILPGEAPDFTIKVGGRVTGVELCEVHAAQAGEPNRRHQEEIHEQIVHAAHEIHRKATKPPVCLSIGFGPATNYRKRDVPRLAAELADCVPVSFATSQKVETLEHGLARPTGVDCIVGHAPMFYEPPEGRWAVSHGGSVYPSETFLQQAIDAKEKKLANYAATAVNEAWLLIVVPNLRASGFLHEPNPEHVFRSSFRRVIVMWLFGLKIMDLKVVAVGPSH